MDHSWNYGEVVQQNRQLSQTLSCCGERSHSWTLIFVVCSVCLSDICLIPRQEIPQQMNGSDCGMFTCKYAEYITKEKPIKFTQVTQPHELKLVLFYNYGQKLTTFDWICPVQRHMPYFRKRMVWELVNRKLLWCQWNGQLGSRTLS